MSDIAKRRDYVLIQLLCHERDATQGQFPSGV